MTAVRSSVAWSELGSIRVGLPIEDLAAFAEDPEPDGTPTIDLALALGVAVDESAEERKWVRVGAPGACWLRLGNAPRIANELPGSTHRLPEFVEALGDDAGIALVVAEEQRFAYLLDTAAVAGLARRRATRPTLEDDR